MNTFERETRDYDLWTALIRANWDNPAEAAALRDGVTSRQAVAAEQVRAVVRRFAAPSASSFEIKVLPQLKTQLKR